MLSDRPGLAVFLLWIGFASQAADQAAGEKSFIAVRTYSAEEDARILKLFDGLRVADVSDGMDIAGLQDVGLMNPEIRPLWRDTESFEHQIRGIAVTVRYVPANKRASKMTPEEFKQWEGKWYHELSPEPFVELLRPGSVIVIDGGEDGDTGTIGSN